MLRDARRARPMRGFLNAPRIRGTVPGRENRAPPRDGDRRRPGEPWKPRIFIAHISKKTNRQHPFAIREPDTTLKPQGLEIIPLANRPISHGASESLDGPKQQLVKSECVRLYSRSISQRA
jgi:hypothetical protein